MSEVNDTLARFMSGDRSMLRCTLCNGPFGQCDCWTKCAEPGCTWSYEKGTSCRNPAHRKESSHD